MAFQRVILPDCPVCNQPSLKVIESRKTEESTRRRKKCQSCGHRVTTHEVSAEFFDQAKDSIWTLSQIQRLVFPSAAIDNLQLVSAGGTSKCGDCIYNIDGKYCSFDFPEYDTDESFDCNHYEQQLLEAA